MNYREAMNYLNECRLGTILVAEDKTVSEYNETAGKLLDLDDDSIHSPLDLIVKFMPMADSGIIYANVGFGRYIKQCPAPEFEELPAGSQMIVFREATKDILYQMLLKTINKLSESVIICDEYSRILMLNEAALAMDSIPAENVIGKTVGNVYHVENDSYLTLPKAIAEKHPELDVRQQYQTMYGNHVDIIASTYPIIEGRQILGAFSVMEDWSQIDELNKRILDLQSQLVNKKSTSQTKRKSSQVFSVKYSFRDIIHISPAMNRVVAKCRQVAKSDSSVMVYGETGTGKELVTQSIHGASKRAGFPFMAINCAAIPATLLESMLFGTERGAYTGAENREGLFEQANGGTLFLDEINSMNIGLQSKLLRVIQDGIVRRVGGDKEIQVDVRVLSNINIPPAQAIAENKLRNDLFYRLGVVNINLPPLRERQEDIHLLTMHFIREFNKKLLKNISDIDTTTLEIFLAYDWPGNVRELQHAIEHAMNIVPEDQSLIAPAHIPEHILTKVGGPLSGKERSDTERPVSLPQILDEVEQRVLSKAMHENQGNISKTSRALGISRQNLQYRLKRMKLDTGK